MQVISLREPCYVQAPGEDILHLPVELCNRMFGWDSACQGLEIFVKNEIPNVQFYALVAVMNDGVTLAAKGELGMHHYFIPWSNILAIHGHIAT